MTDSKEVSGSDDQEMAEQQPQPGPSREGQEAHDLETKGFCIVNWRKICGTAEAAKDKRKAYTSQRQEKAKQRNAFHSRNNKDRIIQAKSYEIQDLCARINGMNQKHREEMERVRKFSDRRIKELSEEVRDGNRLIAEQETDLESRDMMQAILIVDLRELCQVYDEEIALLKETIDRQGKCTPPCACL